MVNQEPYICITLQPGTLFTHLTYMNHRMHKSLYTILGCILLLSCAAQRGSNPENVTIHAFRQPVLQGARPDAIVNTEGKTTESVIKERANYFIYLESPAQDITVKELWVRKVQYGANTENVNTTPVVMLTSIMPGAKPDTLVSRTSNKVLQISIAPGGDAITPSATLQKKIDGNELVMHCIIDGKDYYITVPALKKLPPVALQ